MKKIWILSVICLCLSGPVLAQKTFQPRQLDFSHEGIVYNKELAIDLRLHTNGFALAANVGKIKTYYLTRYYHFEFGEIKHPTENRQTGLNGSSSGRTSRSYIFGKQNNLYVLRAGIGEKRYFSEKAKRKGLAVGVSYEGGLSLGILKPYYLEISYSSLGGSDERVIRSQRYSPEIADVFLDHTKIYGSSSFTRGLGESDLVPGLHFKASVHFDWGAFDELVKAFEVGVMGDAFIKKMPLMVDVPGAENRAYFINLFLSLQLGKRW